MAYAVFGVAVPQGGGGGIGEDGHAVDVQFPHAAARDDDAVIAAPFGAHVAHKVSVTVLRRIFACFVIVVALDMWRKILFAG